MWIEVRREMFRTESCKSDKNVIVYCSIITTYHQYMYKVSRGGVPHLQRQIVGGCDHRAVVPIPCYHGNLHFSYLVFQRRRVVLPEGIRQHERFR